MAIVLPVIAMLDAAGAQQAEARNGGQRAMENPNAPARKETVRDRLWLWGHHAGAHNRQYGLKQDSTITPATAAKNMGIRNILMVRYGNAPAPPFDD